MDGSKQYTEVVNPVTGEVGGDASRRTVNNLRQVIQNARRVQEAWAAVPVPQRVRYIIAIRDYLVERMDELADIIAKDTGKPRIDALVAEILPAMMAISYYGKRAQMFLKDRKLKAANPVLMNKRSKIVRVPYGVIGIISPWNYPFAIAFSEVITGLLSGNAVILKTASATPRTGLALKTCFKTAGLPSGLFNSVNIPGGIAGPALLENGIDKLFFTGSTAVGRGLMTKAAETLTPLCLELGGNDAMLVCEDANIYRAAAGAVWAAFQNSGQSCGGVERIYVHETVYESFMALLKQKVESLRVGSDTNHNVDMGAMISTSQKRAVTAQVAEALSQGATVYARSAGKAGAGLGNFMPAMVLTNVNHSMRLMREETFGPVAAVMKVANMEAAVALANDATMGLTGSVWSRNSKKAERIARRIKAGAVTVNDHLISHGLPETPWGGFKESGIGRTHGELGFYEMTQAQVIVRDLLPGIQKNMWWFPYNETVYQGIKGAAKMLYTKKLKRRRSGFRHLLKIIPRMFKRDPSD